MNLKKGFTLIELLAVIVILAIIALIASPIVVGLIEDSKKSTTERSAENYADGIKIAVANKNLNRENIPDVAYTVMPNGNLCSGNVTGDTCNGETLTIKMDGKTPTSGIVNLSSNGTVATATLCINDVKVIYSDGISEYKSKDCNDMTYSENILNGADPILGSNMIPVRIKDDGTVIYADLKDGWYDYSNKEWANAVMLSSGTYNVGDIIPESAIRSYFVWIPRYKYKIFDEGNYTGVISSKPTESIAQSIEIVFETKDVAISNGSTEGSWLTHPAFTSFNTNGIWVGKFETGYLGATTTAGAQVNSSDSSKIIVKPDVFSWRNNTVYNMFVAAYNYNRSNDSHMMKNTEWGAVAYLSHSKYGINKEININNNSAYKTGYSAAEGTDQTTYPGNYGTGATITLGYKTETGYLASTTGNITGIYDMSGGANEYMASYKSGQLGTSGFDTTTIANYNSKYFDVYSASSSQTTYNYRILGDATGEMGPFYTSFDMLGSYHFINNWHADLSYFVGTPCPWFARGGFYYDGVLSGQFYFAAFRGTVYNYMGSRLVLAIN
ncbi:MAG: prepilin-type N-terminal cleavage/methylation domain-containing protein [Bacilli bacterium]|nr:prepilin-type N-terminal cleavage/methylation domain-containing protein [Bacilli bacterium]